ncbi:MAG: Stp1/IreP family PP2C-type Ser/Thr phosphatase [Fimbriimonadaceae bacterium]|nr:Stp1/IreP family PP2C-type Ser/Thr phosphatase [Fimbriimonadaceae bacterium]QYK56950.1 MAG: Stp1/IreP family PP2C-type Ser/Thr phosphatase [Fimbriimonadaceae bacterium]
MDEITAEYQVAQIAPDVELRVRSRTTVGAKSDLGRVRENNEDKFEFYIPEDVARLAARGLAFVVCDGMGGHEAGQIASELACKTFLDVYYSHPSQEPEAAIRAAVSAANRFVVDVARAVPSRRGMGTTLSALMLVQDQGYIAQVGDSRVYRLRDGELQQLTHDHTWVEDMVRLGAISREEAERHPNRHALTRAIGAEESGEPDVLTFALQEGDVYLLCSDGLTNHVKDAEIFQVLSECGPSEASWRLVSSALIDGGSDNTTLIVVRVDALEPA